MENLEIISTGGGCVAYYFPSPLGRAKGGYFLITDTDGASLPTEGGKAILGWYSDDGQFIDSQDITF